MAGAKAAAGARYLRRRRASPRRRGQQRELTEARGDRGRRQCGGGSALPAAFYRRSADKEEQVRTRLEYRMKRAAGRPTSTRVDRRTAGATPLTGHERATRRATAVVVRTEFDIQFRLRRVIPLTDCLGGV
ncbi:hypothetical protein HPB47_020287 [Ixodes persulcatus]|uniref:Uncharacterized protein n=1 Tax=Ixodes persulcatus TaxID=34615 RepID=A0AC60QFS8_IXOPE|nr:hypothetical protein HPB47_020287 [Ixodes persulcatus]